MRPYETMIIFDAQAEDTAVNAVLDRVQSVIKAHDGVPGPVERWGRRAFAYQLKKRGEGYYVVVEYTADVATESELDRLLSLADEVLRHKTMRVPEKVAGRRTTAPAAEAG